MADDSENPLIKALPPATDYISYLTLVEYNLTKEQLPTLHKVLQDTTLTTNIGWDLVHLLLPLLPESDTCLRDVAQLGNPREVVLKVTELLEEIGREEEDDEEDEEADQEDKTRPPSKAIRLSTLLSLLSILHPRIRTKYPSRFLSTSLQAILSAYASPDLATNTLCASAILDFTRHVAPGGSKRPNVPPRQSSSSIATLQAFQNTQRANQSLSSASAPDPEANTDGVDAGEERLQRRLLQSFMTYVAEVYLSDMPDDADEDAPGMCWASRYMEKMQPEKMVPGRRTMSDLYSDEDKSYHERDTVVGSILAQSRDLSLSPHELLTAILKPTGSSTEPQPEPDQEDESISTLPSSPADVPLSTAGALYILTATLASPLLFQRHHNLPAPSSIELPSYPTLLTSLLPSPTSPPLGTEPPAFLDALFFLGLHLHQGTGRATPPTFPTQALQQLTLLSSRLPSPSQRYLAHTLAKGMLHSHPNPAERLIYIRDTLQHCPYENVRAESVGWVKDEMVNAAAATDLPSEAGTARDEEAAASAAAVFLTPTLLPDLRSFLFPSPLVAAAAANDDATTTEEQEEEASSAFQAMQPFHLAVLNLIYLIFSNELIKARLHAAALSHEIREWIHSLETEVARWEERRVRAEADGGGGGGIGEMGIVKANCAMCLDKLDVAAVA